ncbi:MAG: hypothetical protein BMS9Abin05_1276 [Rhodothermia bacterium]|nr:MAG: hypothetical protein BMS9Abin05_1276 [Rhodothermia bacterium]
MSEYRIRIIPSFFVVLLTLAGCGNKSVSDLSEEDKAHQDSVHTVLNNVNRSNFENAFDRLSNYAYQRYVRTEQYDEQDFLIAYDEVRIQVDGPVDERTTTVERTDSAGAFDFGFFNRFVSENVESVDPVDLVPYVLPDELGYTNPRNSGRYSFRILPDTLMWDRLARVIEVRAKRDLADGLNIRVVRQFVDRATNSLVGVYLERIDLGLLFREESNFYVDLRRADDGEFVPNNTRFESTIKMPFRGTYKIRTVSTYSDYR